MPPSDIGHRKGPRWRIPLGFGAILGAVAISAAGCTGRASGPRARSAPPVAFALTSTRAVDFVTPQQGWIGGRRAIWTTTTGGTTWHRQWSGHGTVRVLTMLSTRRGWALVTRGAAATVLVTDDGGAHWQARPAPAGPPAFAARTGTPGFQAVSPTVAVAAGPTTLWRTTDAGRSWHPVPVPHGGPLQAFDFLNAQTGWAWTGPAAPWSPRSRFPLPTSSGTASGQLWATTSGGQRWHSVGDPALPLTPEGPAMVIAIHAVTPDSGWVVAQVPGPAGQTPFMVVERTADAGHSWVAAVQGPGYIQAVAAQGAAAAILTGCTECTASPYGTESLWLTRDGGIHWRAQSVPIAYLPPDQPDRPQGPRYPPPRVALAILFQSQGLWGWLIAAGAEFVLSPVNPGQLAWQYVPATAGA